MFESFLVRRVLDDRGQHEACFVTDGCEHFRFPSVSAQLPHHHNLVSCAEWLVRHCSGIGLPARPCPTAGHPAQLTGLRRVEARRPHLLVYGHYDVQPPDSLELRQSPPFEPGIAGRLLSARGSSDSQGEHFAHLMAVKACFNSGEALSGDLTFVIDGEEEMGSQGLQKVPEKKRKALDCEGVVISDRGMPRLKCPALTCVRRQPNRFNGTS